MALVTCICSGCSRKFEVLNCVDGVAFKCTTDGVGATIFQLQGDGFDCYDLVLLHSRFYSHSGTNQSCSNGSIVGVILGVKGNCYISQLLVKASFDLTGKTIKCIHESYNGSRAVSELVGIYKGMNYDIKVW